MSGHVYISTSPAPSPRLGEISKRGSGPETLFRRCEQLCGAVHHYLLADVLNVQQPIENGKQHSSEATVCPICACMCERRLCASCAR
jgi:hypothetical protein